jgi:hypothetical protein
MMNSLRPWGDLALTVVSRGEGRITNREWNEAGTTPDKEQSRARWIFPAHSRVESRASGNVLTKITGRTIRIVEDITTFRIALPQRVSEESR